MNLFIIESFKSLRSFKQFTKDEASTTFKIPKIHLHQRVRRD